MANADNPIIITRKQARQNNLYYYYTGKACKHGHVSKRFTHNGQCKKCNLVWQKAYQSPKNAEYKARHTNTEKHKIYIKSHKYKASVKKAKKKYLSKPDSRKKTRAHAIVYRALKVGLLEKFPCCICANPISEAHHEDYSKPLEVIWMCHKCHFEYHAKIRETKGA